MLIKDDKGTVLNRTCPSFRWAVNWIYDSFLKLSEKKCVHLDFDNVLESGEIGKFLWKRFDERHEFLVGEEPGGDLQGVVGLRILSLQQFPYRFQIKNLIIFSFYVINVWLFRIQDSGLNTFYKFLIFAMIL